MSSNKIVTRRWSMSGSTLSRQVRVRRFINRLGTMIVARASRPVAGIRQRILSLVNEDRQATHGNGLVPAGIWRSTFGAGLMMLSPPPCDEQLGVTALPDGNAGALVGHCRTS